MLQHDDEAESFKTERKFFDDEHFPYGFDRSGEFSSSQVALLERHGHAYRALATGERQPVTEQESQFVLLCNGAKEPQNVHEKVWKRYSEICNKALVFHSVALSRISDYADDFPIDTD